MAKLVERSATGNCADGRGWKRASVAASLVGTWEKTGRGVTRKDPRRGSGNFGPRASSRSSGAAGRDGTCVVGPLFDACSHACSVPAYLVPPYSIGTGRVDFHQLNTRGTSPSLPEKLGISRPIQFGCLFPETVPNLMARWQNVTVIHPSIIQRSDMEIPGLAPNHDVSSGSGPLGFCRSSASSDLTWHSLPSSTID